MLDLHKLNRIMENNSPHDSPTVYAAKSTAWIFFMTMMVIIYIPSSKLLGILWIYCPTYADVCSNERADSPASGAPITSILKMGRIDILQTVRDRLMKIEMVI